MVHSILGDAQALSRYAVDGVPDAIGVPDTFECEECQDVREAILAWQQEAEGKCERGECECRFHVYEIGFL